MMLKIKVVIVDDESGEQLINEDFHSLPLAICYMETVAEQLTKGGDDG